MNNTKYIKKLVLQGGMGLTSNDTIRFLKTNYSKKELEYIQEHTKEIYEFLKQKCLKKRSQEI